MTMIRVRGMASVARQPGDYSGDKKAAAIGPMVCLDHAGVKAELSQMNGRLDRYGEDVRLIRESLEQLVIGLARGK